MAIKQPKPISLSRAVYICLVAAFAPEKFNRLEKEFDADLGSRADAPAAERIEVVRRGYRTAGTWMLGALVCGILIGLLLRSIFGPVTIGSAIVAVSGTVILLWTTLALQGWTVQTYSDTTLTERVNRWLFRFLYAVGTALRFSGDLAIGLEEGSRCAGSVLHE
ncbi:hypothetical protein [Mesorhizobium sp.]|uniref:hypothetical protein n=1 Tax=Mesorhizobium sp. TaxID=1871066 RepID=UPI000FE87510|nr:hypothetical protein [Mesorhizobium sp.]RWD35574.1 MAG: hypothetical protein EOS33_07225 [Mesorhizobium sp.]